MNKDRLYIILVVCTVVFSFFMIVFSVVATRVVPNGPLYVYKPVSFNLAYYVPLGLWIAIFVMSGVLLLLHFRSCKFMSAKSASLLTIVISLIIVVALQGFPYMVETNPRFVDSWVHGRTARGILDSGVLQPEQYKYQEYPSSFVLLTTLSLVIGVPLTVLLRFIPILFVVLFFSFLALLAYKFFGNLKLASLSTLVYGLSTFGLAFHFSPAIFGWSFFILFLTYLLRNVHENRERPLGSRGDFIIILFLLVGIATTHAVTQFMTVLTIIALFALARKIWTSTFASRDLSIILVLAIMVFSIWASFSSWSNFSSYLNGFITAFQTVLSNFSSSIAAQPLQARYPLEATVLLNYRQVLYAATLVCSFAGGYVLWKNDRRSFKCILAILVASIMEVPLTLLGILPLERAIELAFIPLSMLAAYLVANKKRFGGLFLIFLLASFPINFASLYWNEAGRDMYHDWEIDSAKFIGSTFHGVILAEFKETGIQMFFGNFSGVYNDYYLVGSRPDLFDMYNYTFIIEHGIELVYITELTAEIAGERSGQSLTPSILANRPILDCVQSNGYSTVLVKIHT